MMKMHKLIQHGEVWQQPLASQHQPELSRRKMLRISLAAASLLTIGACTTGNPSKEKINSANQQLQLSLQEIAANDDALARLTAIAKRIETQSQQLIQLHNQFTAEFEALANKRNTDSTTLLEMAEDYNIRMIQQRDALIRTQDEVKGELNEDEWAEAVHALNQTSASRWENN